MTTQRLCVVTTKTGAFIGVYTSEKRALAAIGELRAKGSTNEFSIIVTRMILD